MKNQDDLIGRLDQLEKRVVELEKEMVLKHTDLYKKAREYVILRQEVSPELLQKAFKVGFTRANKIIDQLKEDGVINRDSIDALEVLVKR